MRPLGEYNKTAIVYVVVPDADDVGLPRYRITEVRTVNVFVGKKHVGEDMQSKELVNIELPVYIDLKPFDAIVIDDNLYVVQEVREQAENSILKTVSCSAVRVKNYTIDDNVIVYGEDLYNTGGL